VTTQVVLLALTDEKQKVPACLCSLSVSRESLGIGETPCLQEEFQLLRGKSLSSRTTLISRDIYIYI
jgi:hypothetical protein